jgi:hypothetical protein
VVHGGTVRRSAGAPTDMHPVVRGESVPVAKRGRVTTVHVACSEKPGSENWMLGPAGARRARVHVSLPVVRAGCVLAGLLALSCANPAVSVEGIGIIINEFMVRNTGQSGMLDADGKASDWVEIYNAGADSLLLSAYFISDRLDRPRRFRFEDTVLAPGAFYVAWGGGSTSSPDNHIGFNFSASETKDEKVLLFDEDGMVVDSISFAQIPEARQADIAYGRLPDAARRWAAFSTATPGASNAR